MSADCPIHKILSPFYIHSTPIFPSCYYNWDKNVFYAAVIHAYTYIANRNFVIDFWIHEGEGHILCIIVINKSDEGKPGYREGVMLHVSA